MWASPEGNNNSHRVCTTSPSKSSSSKCLSPSPTVPNPSSISNRKSMEEVWKEINLGSLQDHHTVTTTNKTNNYSAFPGMILQDFLASPFNKDPPPQLPPRAATTSGTASFLNFLGPPPATMLSLTSGSHFQCLRSSVSMRQNQNQNQNQNHPQSHTHTSICSSPFEASISPCVSKRPQDDDDDDDDDNSGDRRHKRLIKNRESAARSRARKQAYTYELELEVARLQEENTKLKRQQEQFLTAPTQLPEKSTLCRASTAPF